MRACYNYELLGGEALPPLLSTSMCKLTRKRLQESLLSLVLLDMKFDPSLLNIVKLEANAPNVSL